jgi:hypothetical protein
MGIGEGERGRVPGSEGGGGGDDKDKDKEIVQYCQPTKFLRRQQAGKHCVGKAIVYICHL